MTVDDHFRIGSNTKTMTSTVILQLVQEGKLALDDPIGKYIPNVPDGDTDHHRQLVGDAQRPLQLLLRHRLQQHPGQYPQKAWAPQELLDIAFSHPVEFATGRRVRLQQHQHHPAGPGDREAHRNDCVRGVPGAHLHPARAEEHLAPGSAGYGRSRARTRRDTPSAATPRPSRPTPCPRRTSAARWPEPCCRTTRPMANPSWGWTAGGAISTVEDMKTYVEALVDGGLLDARTQKIRMDSITPTDPAEPSGRIRAGNRQVRPAVRP